MKAKLIGIGAAGNKAAIKAIELGVFDKASVRIMNTTVKDINHDYDDISVIFGNQRGGCGKGWFYYYHTIYLSRFFVSADCVLAYSRLD